MANELNCKTGLQPNIINQEAFKREITLCQKLNKENQDKSGWGQCDNCGVIPLLHKLHKGELLEKPNIIPDIKNNLFN